ncbi:glycerol-3-phosphate 1-O-acyltransferase PlsY [Mycoplasmatota bacterium WC44]
MFLLNEIIWLIVAYFIGSIPFSLIIGKIFSSTDIRNHGSGNLGATNAIRVLGKKQGITAAVLDVFKSFILVYLADKGIIDVSFSPLYLGVAAAFGHCYPIFANFRGGKAVATSAGAILAISPLLFGIGVVIFFTILKVTKYVSLSSTLVAIVVILSAYLLGESTDTIIASSILVLFIMYRHIPNYKRLIKGNENKANI